MKNTKFWKVLAYVVTAFVILEPVWMLLPFAGFLYGSVLNLDFLESSRATSWLLLFVFPTRRLMLTGLLLVLTGLTVFLICACRVYISKFFKRGLVTGGIYKYLRHPQYTALIVAGLGFVILWGRFIAFLSFFIMIYLYYLLSGKEEAVCRAKYGKAYGEYREKTMGIIPGTDFLENFFAHSRLSFLPKPVAVLSGFLLIVTFAIISGFVILKTREATATKLPIIKKEIQLDEKRLPLIIPKIPYLDEDRSIHSVIISALRKKELSPEIFFKNLRSSRRIQEKLSPFYELNMNAVFVIFRPRTSIVKEKGNTFVNFFLVPVNVKPGYLSGDAKTFRKNCGIKGLVKVERMVMTDEIEPVKGNIEVLTVNDRKKDKKILASIESKINVVLSRFY